MKNKPIYIFSRETARLTNNVDLWQESFQLNCDSCAYMMELFSQGYDGRYVPKNIVPIAAEKYGMARVERILAYTIQAKDYDGRISRENKAWAKSIAVYDSTNDARFYIFDENPGVTDILADSYRKLVKATTTPKMTI